MSGDSIETLLTKDMNDYTSHHYEQSRDGIAAGGMTAVYEAHDIVAYIMSDGKSTWIAG